MALLITDDRMSSDLCATVATRRDDGRWTVTGRPGAYDRNQAITAMTLAEEYASGKTIEDPFVQGWEAELEEKTDGA